MLAHLRTRVTAWLWDARITWRLDNEHLRPFHDAPDEVVARWAAIDENSVRHYQLHGGILMARDEQTQRACRWRVVDPVVVNQPEAGILLQENAAGHQPEIHPCTIDNVPTRRTDMTTTLTRLQMAERVKQLAAGFAEAYAKVYFARQCGRIPQRTEDAGEAAREALHAAIDALATVEAGSEWMPMDSAPRGKRLLGNVNGVVRFIFWAKVSHVPIYGWCCVDGDPEDTDICEPSGWMHLPAITAAPAEGGGARGAV